jgi:hypothetical protein
MSQFLLVDGRNPAPVDRWFIPLFIYRVSTILLVVQDFATIHSMKPTRFTMIVDSKLPICR